MDVNLLLDGVLVALLLAYTIWCVWICQTKRQAPCLQIGDLVQLNAISATAVKRAMWPALQRTVIVGVLVWRLVEFLLGVGASLVNVVVFATLWAMIAFYHLWVARLLTESVYEATRMGFGRK